MKQYLNRRSLCVASMVLGSQLLSACIILPRPHLPFPRAVVVVPGAGHHHDRRGDDRQERRDRRDRHDGNRY